VDPSITKAYLDFIWKGETTNLAGSLYDSPVISIGGIKDRVGPILDRYREMKWHTPDRLKAVKTTLIETNRELGALTPQVRENIDNITTK